MPLQRIFRISLLILALCPPTAGAAGPALDDRSSLVTHVLALLDERIGLMPDVAAAKWIAHQPVGDPAREAQVVASFGELVSSYGLARSPSEALMRLEINAARDVQTSHLDRWSQEGKGPDVAPSLQDEIRPKIDRITRELASALYLAAPFLDSEELSAQVAQLPAQHWSEPHQRALTNALRNVRLETPRTTDRLKRSGHLRVGVPADYAPFAWQEDQHLVGADIDLIEEIAGPLGLKPIYIRSSWSTLLDDLAADHFDIAIGGISVNEKRRERAGFSISLVTGGKTAIGRCSDVARFSIAENIDQEGIRVIENPGGTNEIFARKHLQHARLTVHIDNISIFDELALGHADVMYTDDFEVSRVARRYPTLCRLLEATFEPADKAILLPLSDDWPGVFNPVVAPVVEQHKYLGFLTRAIAR